MDALSKPELLALLAAARKHKERDFLMILVAYCHGLRATEVVGGWHEVKVSKRSKKKIKVYQPGVRPCDIKDGCLEMQRLKGSRRTKQPLLEHENPLLNEREALFAFLAKSNGKQRLFPVSRQQFGRIVKRHGKTAGLPDNKRHPHMLKHTIGTEIYRKTKDLNLLQGHLGHKRAASSLIYAEQASAQEVAKGVQKLVDLDD